MSYFGALLAQIQAKVKILLRTLCLREFNIQRKLEHICLLNIFLIYHFEVI